MNILFYQESGRIPLDKAGGILYIKNRSVDPLDRQKNFQGGKFRPPGNPASVGHKVIIMNNGYEEIKQKDKLIAIILRADFHSDKLMFFSPKEFSQQLGFLPHKKGHVIPAHFHKRVQREIEFTQEVLFIRKGKIEVNFYTPEKEFLLTRELNTGDVIFLCSGGHGFRILEDSEMIEVKQGPYSGREGDKITFKGIEHDPGI